MVRCGAGFGLLNGFVHGLDHMATDVGVDAAATNGMEGGWVEGADGYRMVGGEAARVRARAVGKSRMVPLRTCAHGYTSASR